MALGTPEGSPTPAARKKTKPEPKVIREFMYQFRKVCNSLPNEDMQPQRYQKQHTLALENKLLRADLERFRQERQVLEDFWIKMSLGEFRRRDTKLIAKREALDKALAGPTRAELEAFQHQIMVLEKRLQEADMELATVKAEPAQAQAERDGQELRLKLWMMGFDESSRAAREATEKVERLTVELETVKSQTYEFSRQRRPASAGETEEWFECFTHGENGQGSECERDGPRGAGGQPGQQR